MFDSKVLTACCRDRVIDAVCHVIATCDLVSVTLTTTFVVVDVICCLCDCRVCLYLSDGAEVTTHWCANNTQQKMKFAPVLKHILGKNGWSSDARIYR